MEFLSKSENGVDSLQSLALHGMTTVIILKEFFHKEIRL
jgi:predicted DNA-binding ribbon-helix-helix protein